jgi:hypothetical protein
MTAVSDRKAEEPAQWCPQCGAAGEFGYCDVCSAMRWFCARHRLAQFWADARMPAPLTNHGGVLTDDNDHQQIDRAVAEPAAGSFSYPADGLSWDRPGPDVDRPGLVRRPAGTHRLLTAVAEDVVGLILRNDALRNAVGDCLGNGMLGRAEHLQGLFGALSALERSYIKPERIRWAQQRAGAVPDGFAPTWTPRPDFEVSLARVRARPQPVATAGVLRWRTKTLIRKQQEASDRQSRRNAHPALNVGAAPHCRTNFVRSSRLAGR